MAEYIARDKLWEAFVDEPFYDNADKDEIVLPIIGSFPAADVAPVRHGRWISTDRYLGQYKCSACEIVDADCSDYYHSHNVLDQDYCPYCGAKMDGGADK